MGNFNLPPGCTDADIDRAMGGDEECYHEEYEIDILDGRAHCYRCGEKWWPTDEETRWFIEAEPRYAAYLRREERREWWREFWKDTFLRPTFPIRWAVRGFLNKVWPRRKFDVISVKDEVPF